MRVRLTAGAVFATLLGAIALLAPSAAAESTSSAFGSRLVTLINDARAQHGLRALTVASGTSSVAASWTSHLASQQALSHNPNLGAQLESHGSPNWTTYAENVADGDTASADAMFQNYMNSAEHRGNILNGQFRYVGVGVVFTGSTAWNTLDFVDQYTSTSSSSPSPSPTPTKSTTTTRTTTTRTTTTRTTTTSTTTRARTAAPTSTTPARQAAPAPRTAARTTSRVSSAHHTASVPSARQRSVSHRPSTVRPAVPAHHAAAHALAAPSPAALATPDHGGSDRNAAPLLATLLIALVVATRFGLRRLVRGR